jgi:hypothetical protein
LIDIPSAVLGFICGGACMGCIVYLKWVIPMQAEIDHWERDVRHEWPDLDEYEVPTGRQKQ